MNVNRDFRTAVRTRLSLPAIAAGALGAALNLTACGPQSGTANVAGTPVPVVSPQAAPVGETNGVQATVQPNGQAAVHQATGSPVDGQVVASRAPNNGPATYPSASPAYPAQANANAPSPSYAQPQSYAHQAQDEAAPSVRATTPTRVSAPVVASAHLGEVRAIEPIRERPQGNGTGAVIGGVLGAVVGNQFGHGGGRAVTTVLGAAGGAVAGNNVERNHREGIVGYRVSVRLDDGTSRTFQETDASEFRVGDRVRVERGQLRPG